MATEPSEPTRPRGPSPQVWLIQTGDGLRDREVIDALVARGSAPRGQVHRAQIEGGYGFIDRLFARPQ